MSALVDLGVTNALKNDATLATLSPGGLYRDVAPEAVVSAAISDPSQVFGILTLQSEVPRDAFDNKPLDETLLMIKFVEAVGSVCLPRRFLVPRAPSEGKD